MKKSNALQIFSGIGMGILIGVVIGLSVSHVVGIILGALTSLLAAFLGLKEDSEKSVDSKKGLLIGVFCFSCLGGIIVGIYFRTHDTFSLSLKDQKQKWVEVGFSDAEARNIVLYQETGCIFENNTQSNFIDTAKGKSIQLAPAKSDLSDKHTGIAQALTVGGKKGEILKDPTDRPVSHDVGVLMNGQSKGLICDNDDYPNISQYIKAYRLSGNRFKLIADSVVHITKDTTKQRAILQAIKNSICK